MISVENLRFAYNQGTTAEIQALLGIEAFINDGEFVAVIGHNGCGKSTLSKHFNALLIPGGGKVVIDGIDTADQSRLFEIRKKCGMVFQNPDNQMVATVVEEEVAFGPENLGVSPEEIRRRITDALAAVGISGQEKRSSALLSGGQKQRLAIAGIIAMHPRYIILDESTSMLDPKGRREVMETVRRLNTEEKMTVIFITHSMDEAALADRVIVMEKGKIVMEGPPEKVFSNVETLRELRLDVPPMAELAHMLTLQGINLPDGIISIDRMEEELAAALSNQKNERRDH